MFIFPLSFGQIRKWIPLKLNNITIFQLNHIVFYMNQLENSDSGVISVVFSRRLTLLTVCDIALCWMFGNLS